MSDEKPEMTMNWTSATLSRVLEQCEGATLRISYDMDHDEWVACIADEEGGVVTCEWDWDVYFESRSPKMERALELLELVCKADRTYEVKVGDTEMTFDRYLTLVLNGIA